MAVWLCAEGDRACLPSLGKLGIAPAGCVSEVVEMECGRAEVDDMIKEVSAAGCRWKRRSPADGRAGSPGHPPSGLCLLGASAPSLQAAALCQ